MPQSDTKTLALLTMLAESFEELQRNAEEAEREVAAADLVAEMRAKMGADVGANLKRCEVAADRLQRAIRGLRRAVNRLEFKAAKEKAK